MFAGGSRVHGFACNPAVDGLVYRHMLSSRDYKLLIVWSIGSFALNMSAIMLFLSIVPLSGPRFFWEDGGMELIAIAACPMFITALYVFAQLALALGRSGTNKGDLEHLLDLKRRGALPHNYQQYADSSAHFRWYLGSVPSAVPRTPPPESEQDVLDQLLKRKRGFAGVRLVQEDPENTNPDS